MLVRGVIKDVAGIPYICMHKNYKDSISEGEAIMDMMQRLTPKMDVGDTYHVKVFDSGKIRTNYID